MKITCPRSNLLEAVNTVQRAISSKTTMPILECIKLESIDDSHVLVTGTNIDLFIEYNLKCEVIEGGTVALESKMFGEIVRKMPEDNVLIEVQDSNDVTKIECGRSKFSIRGQNPTGYPQSPTIEEQFSLTIEESDLKKIIRKALPFIAINEGKRPVLTGALFDIKGKQLTVVTTDSHRIAAIKEELDDSTGDAKIVVPGQTLRELLKILHDEGSVKLIAGDRKLLFEFKNFKLVTRLLEGEFLRYEAIISAVNPISMKIEKKTLMNSLERAILLINDDVSSYTDNKVPVRLSLGYDKLDISCMTGKGQVQDTISADIDGGELEIGFNCRFLLDAMGVCDDEEIKIEFSAPTSGCFIKANSEEQSYVYMILPVRLYN